MIRVFNELEIPHLVDIWYRASTLAHPFLESTFVEKVRKDMEELYLPNSNTWVYELDGKAVAFISMMENEIAGLFVFPEYHSKGIGSQLVNHVLCNNNELNVEVFENNNIGRAFYEKYGFVQYGQYLHQESQQITLRLKYSPASG